MAILGIDVSNWQAEVDWGAVAASGVQFAIVKASEGTTFLDGYLARNWHGIPAAGLARGAYHFAQPNQNQPEAEAAWFLSCVQGAGGLADGDVLVLDLEAGTGNLVDWTQRWLAAVTAAVGFRPLLYSGMWFMEPHGLVGDPQLAEHGLWLAAYGSVPPAPPPLWPVLALWQFSCTGRVPGVDGDCDCNVFNGAIEQFRLYGKPGAVVEPPPQPSPGLPWDCAAQLETITQITAGVAPADLQAWLAQFS